MRRYRIGYVTVPGFSETDLIAMQAVLGIHPLNQAMIVSSSMEPVTGKKVFSFIPDTDFTNCPDLDVVVLGGVPDEALNNNALLNFLSEKVDKAKFVLAGANGVDAFANCGVLKDRAVTDAKFYTGGASTGMIEAAYLLLKRLRGERIAKLAELSLEYDPHPQFKNKETNVTAFSELNLPKGPKMAVIAPKGTYLPDVMGAVEVLGSIPGSEVCVVSDTMAPSNCLLGPKVVPHATYDDCQQADIVIIGATTPNHLKNKSLLDFIRRQETGAKAMISVCAGTLVFAAAGILDGRKVTTNFHCTPLLKRLGAVHSETETAVDGKFYSAGPAIGSYEVGVKAAADLYGEDAARFIEQSVLEYDPHPVFNTGSPEKAGRVLTWVSRALMLPALPFYLSYGRNGRQLVGA